MRSWAIHRSRRRAFVALTVMAAISAVAALATPPTASASAVLQTGSLQGVGDATFIANPDATGLWFSTAWSTPTLINHVVLIGPLNPSKAPPQSIMTFSDGSNLMLTPNAHGDVSISITPRRVTSVSIRAVVNPVGHPVEVSSFSLDANGSTVGSGGGVPEASSGTPAALSDGNVSAGSTGAVWQAAVGDTARWAGIRFPSDREVSSVQIFGAPRGGAASWGDLVFSDGSKVRVSSVDGAGGQPTTIAFTPRITTTVRYVPQSAGAFALREFVVGERGFTLPRFPVSGATYSVPTPSGASACGLDSPAVGSVAAGGIALVCPAVGASVGGTTRIVVMGPVGASLRASAWVPRGSRDTDGVIATVGTAVVGASGRASFLIDTSTLSHGPFAVRITVDGSAPQGNRLLYVQLDNSSGVTVSSPGYAPSGMTLAWYDDFSSGVASTRTGLGTVYGTLQPQPGGAGQFGDGVFVDPSSGTGNIGTLDGSTLRMRAMPLVGTDSTGWGRTMQGGMLSSGHTDGSGTLAQYGYFEMRALGAPGQGSWPAFWLVSGDAAAGRGATSSEIDIEELYGHNPIYGCQSILFYTFSPKSTLGGPSCKQFGSGDGYSTDDWALRWHTYGALVTPSVTRYYIDGRLVNQHADVPNSDQPYFFMIDEALGGGYPVQLQQTGNVTDFYVDWVKVSS